MIGILDVYLYDIFVGQLVQADTALLSFTYNKEYLSRKDAHQVSISLPLREEPYSDEPTRAFFLGLLPEDVALQRLAKFLRIPEGNLFALLAAVGGECAGALSFYPQGTEKPNYDDDGYEVLEDDHLKEIISILHQRPLLAGEKGVRLSLAGAQDKLAVCLINDQIALAKGDLPTTHILKPKIRELEGTVDNEVYCMTLARQVGLNTPDVEIRYTGKTPYYLIERFDREVLTNGNVRRLHQEDFCQALSIQPYRKYEDNGGPGISDCLQLILSNSAQPVIDIPEFIRIQIFNYLIGNADAHGKNFSLLYKNATPVLAPAYDLLSTVVYPRLSKKCAMKVGGEDVPEKILLEQWYALVPKTQSARLGIEEELKNMAEKIVRESATLKEEFLVRKFNKIIIPKIHKTIQKRAKHILSYF